MHVFRVRGHHVNFHDGPSVSVVPHYIDPNGANNRYSHRDGLNLRAHPAERAEVGQHFLRLELLPAAEELLGDVFRPYPAILRI